MGQDRDRDRAPSPRYADLLDLLRDVRASARWQQIPAAQAETLGATVDLVTVAAAEDYLALHRLIDAYGHQRVARMQGGLARLVGNEVHARLETGLIWRIGDERHTERRLTAAGVDPETAADVAACCYGHMFWVLLRDIDKLPQVTELPDRRGFYELIKRGTVHEWRAALAPVAAHPWGPRGEELAVLAEEAGLPVVAQSLRTCQRAYQMLREDEERREAADEIRRLVAASGYTQKAFAAYVGTSPSRLSTYVSGKVTPSAAMLLRIQRASALLAGRGPEPPVTS